MKLYNTSSNSVLFSPIIVAESFRDRTVGLIGNKNKEALHFKTRWGLHTFGMAYPLTIIICNDDLVVKKVIHTLATKRFLFWNPAWQIVFELPSGNYRVKVGDRIVLMR